MIRCSNSNDERTAMSERDGFEPGTVFGWETDTFSMVLADPQGATLSISRMVPA